MQSAMGSLVDVKQKYNEQELEDELADLLSKDEPIASNTEKHHIPGSILVTCNVAIVIMIEKYILQTYQMYQTTVWKVKNWTLTVDSSC